MTHLDKLSVFVDSIVCAHLTINGKACVLKIGYDDYDLKLFKKHIDVPINFIEASVISETEARFKFDQCSNLIPIESGGTSIIWTKNNIVVYYANFGNFNNWTVIFCS